MFCPNCGNKIKENENFCGSCGHEIKKMTLGNNNLDSTTMVEKLSKLNPLKPVWSIIKDVMKLLSKFILKNKKIFYGVIGVMVTLIISSILFNIFYDFTKLSWDKEKEDLNIDYTVPTTLELKVNALDKKDNEIKDIDFSVTDGTVEVNGQLVLWSLPDVTGEYTITATAPSGKKITKSVEVLNFDFDNLAGIDVPEEDNDDKDNDGLSNEMEKEYGTDPLSGDTDKDGIGDWYEINESKTDPLKKDTDNDQIRDGDELDLGLNPLKIDSKGDGVNDGERTLTYTVTDDNIGVTVDITGKGNIASSTVDMFSNITFNNMDGVLNKIYNLYTTGTLESATVKIKYNPTEILNQGMTEDNLALYYFNEETKKLEEVETTVDKQNNLLIVTINHFSKYVIGDKSTVITDYDNDIMLLVDNSISMYSEDQIVGAGYDYWTGYAGNDKTFKRIKLSNQLVDMFTGNYRFGVGQFSGSYINLTDITDDVEKVKSKINSIENDLENITSGTNIISALTNGIDKFTVEKNNRYMILMTDGQNTVGYLDDKKDDIISSAKEKNVRICVIGLGDDVEKADLQQIATETGCGYYHAANDSVLDQIYAKVGADINYNYVDTDGDNVVDGMVEYDTGFITTRDGFNFRNYGTQLSPGGNCFGLAVFAMQYYTDDLLVAMDNTVQKQLFIEHPADGYNLDDTYFFDNGNRSNNNLYDYEIMNEALQLVLYDRPKDYWGKIEDQVLYVNNKYYKSLDEIGTQFPLNKYNDPKNRFDHYQDAVINTESDKYKNSIKKDTQELLKAVYRLFVMQYSNEMTSFINDPDKAYDELVDYLKKGIPVVTNVRGNHAVNSLRLIRDLNDANKFKIEVYDNNYPGQTKYIEVVRSKYSKWQLGIKAWKNEYDYTFSYEDDQSTKSDDKKNKDIKVGVYDPF